MSARKPALYWFTARKSVQRFNVLQEAGFIDLDSGAWERDRNARLASCGRCDQAVRKGEGRAYREFHRDRYRSITRFACPICAGEIFPANGAE